MKIYMGPYVGNGVRCQFHSNYMNKKYGHDWGNNTKFEVFLEKVEDFVQDILNATINRFLWKRKRKIKIRIDYYDTWSMDHNLALIILPMLKQLKKTKHGSPHTDPEDVPEHLRSDPNRIKMNEEGKIEHWDVDNTVHQRWEWILDEMIYAFEAEADDEYEEKFRSGEIDIDWEKSDTGYVLNKGPNDTYKFDQEAYNIDYARRKNGLRLFGKYYHGLWD